MYKNPRGWSQALHLPQSTDSICSSGISMGNNITNVVNYAPSEELDSLDPGFEKSVMVVQCILTVTGSSGNFLTLMAVILHKNLHNLHNVYIAHLACVDLLISLFMIPTNLAGFFGIGWSTFACEIIATLSLSCLVVSILTLMMIYMNR